LWQGRFAGFFEASVGVGGFFGRHDCCSKRNAPRMRVFCADAHTLPDLGKQFDFIILSDLVNDVWDVQTVLAQLKPYCTSKTRLVINFYNR
jgi:hypothetical protein